MIRNASAVRLLAAVTCVAFFARPADADPVYNITALNNDPGGTPYAAIALNNLGQVVGYSPSGPNWQQGYGFVYDGSPGGTGAVTPLGGSTAPTGYPPVRNSTPNAINDEGLIAGRGAPGSGLGTYLYSNGQTTAIPYGAVALNNAGQVLSTTAGSLYDSIVPVIYNPATGSTQVLPTLPNAIQAIPTAFNDSGQVVGNTYVSPNGLGSSGAWGNPFLVSGGKAIDLGSLGGSSGQAAAINDSGEVVGNSALTNNLVFHAFLYSNGKMIDLGTLPGFPNSEATSINAQGQIVGQASSANGSLSNAFLYQNGVMTNLNSLISPNSGWTINFAQSINNLGQILALASTATTESEVLLTPTNLAAPGDPQYVVINPEPGSLAVFGLMMGALVLKLRLPRKSRADSASNR